MEIISFEAENFMRLTAARITPTGALVEINGKNGNGKTSVLTAIASAFGGAEEAPSMAIRKGADKASVKIAIGTGGKIEYRIEETFRYDKNNVQVRQLRVFTADGAEYKSPQTLMNSLWNKISIDPLQFAEMRPAEQFSAMQQFVPDVDFTGIAMKNAADYSARTEQNRIAKEARAAADTIVETDTVANAPVDEAALIAELEAAGRHNSDIETRRANRQRARDQLDQYGKDVQRLDMERGQIEHDTNEEIERIRKECEERILNLQAGCKARIEERNTAIAGIDEKINDLAGKLETAGELPAAIDTADIRQRIDAAKQVNANFENNRKRAQLIATAKSAEEKAEALTAQRDARTKAKHEAIAAAELPIEGLGFGEGFITLAGVPFDQASDADKLRVSLAVAMAANPKLKVIRVQRGSLLDSDSLKLMGEMVGDKGYQVWCERTTDGGGNGFIIEDGHVKAPEAATL